MNEVKEQEEIDHTDDDINEIIEGKLYLGNVQAGKFKAIF